MLQIKESGHQCDLEVVVLSQHPLGNKQIYLISVEMHDTRECGVKN